MTPTLGEAVALAVTVAGAPLLAALLPTLLIIVVGTFTEDPVARRFGSAIQLGCIVTAVAAASGWLAPAAIWLTTGAAPDAVVLPLAVSWIATTGGAFVAVLLAVLGSAWWLADLGRSGPSEVGSEIQDAPVEVH